MSSQMPSIRELGAKVHTRRRRERGERSLKALAAHRGAPPGKKPGSSRCLIVYPDRPAPGPPPDRREHEPTPGECKPGPREHRAAEGSECPEVTGGVGYLLRVETPDLAAYNALHTDVIGTAPHVAAITTYVVMESPKDERA